MKKIYRAEIVDEDTGTILTQISSYSEEGMMEEMGKSKWTKLSKDELPTSPLRAGQDPDDDEEENELGSHVEAPEVKDIPF